MWKLDHNGTWQYSDDLELAAPSILSQYLENAELLDEEIEVLIPYVESLQAIGVDFENPQLQDDLAANLWNLEAATLRTLEYAQKLHTQGYDFEDKLHPTNHLAYGLRVGWKPFNLAYRLAILRTKFEQILDLKP
ncbi:MAG: hypothetical protein LH660_09445 [Phormidesmis sp. CAN_BIN36]|nr:hypothetical protein [Phormidesmis sp. CAN_BIN36]